MHKVLKFGTVLCVMFTFLLIINIDNVSADCYRIDDLNAGTSYYSSDPVQGPSLSSSSVGDNYCASKNYEENLISCGDDLLNDLPSVVPQVVHIIYLIVQILIPILIVIFGSLDLVKGVYAQKEDEIKKGQQVFIKRLITGAIVFFVFAIVRLVISFAADSSSARILDCASCIINNNEDCVVQK